MTANNHAFIVSPIQLLFFPLTQIYANKFQIKANAFSPNSMYFIALVDVENPIHKMDIVFAIRSPRPF